MNLFQKKPIKKQVIINPQQITPIEIEQQNIFKDLQQKVQIKEDNIELKDDKKNQVQKPQEIEKPQRTKLVLDSYPQKTEDYDYFNWQQSDQFELNDLIFDIFKQEKERINTYLTENPILHQAITSLQENLQKELIQWSEKRETDKIIIKLNPINQRNKGLLQINTQIIQEITKKYESLQNYKQFYKEQIIEILQKRFSEILKSVTIYHDSDLSFIRLIQNKIDSIMKNEQQKKQEYIKFLQVEQQKMQLDREKNRQVQAGLDQIHRDLYEKYFQPYEQEMQFDEINWKIQEVCLNEQ